MRITRGSRPDERDGLATAYPAFHDVIEGGWTVPGLDTKFVPQGACWLPGGHRIAVTYYHYSGTKPSRLVVIHTDSGTSDRQFVLHDEDGDEYFGHAGGVAVHGRWLWVCSGGRALRFDLDDLERDEDSIAARGGFDADSRCSFMSSDGDHLWLGEFRHVGQWYKTRKHHCCPVDDSKGAWVAGYKIDLVCGDPVEPPRYEVKGAAVHAPAKVVFVRDRVQGMAVCGKRIALSISYGAADSLLAFYDNPLDGEPFEVSLPDGSTTEGFLLSLENNYLATLKMPAGSQDLDWDGKRLLTVFEGGSRIYRDRWRLTGALIEDRAVVMRVPKRKELKALHGRVWGVGSTITSLGDRAVRAVQERFG